MNADTLKFARTTDADTSYKAAEITVDGWGKVRAAVYAILAQHGPLTHDEIHAYYREAGGRRTVQRIRTATRELVNDGMVRRSNLLGLSFNGGESQKWEVVS